VSLHALTLPFLNSREKAALVWLVITAVFVARHPGSGLGIAIANVLRSALLSKLVVLWLVATAYSVPLVYLAWRIGLWHPSASKETIYWFVGSQLPTVGAALSSHAQRAFVLRIMRRTLRWTILVEFFVSFFVFPLLIELVLVPVVILIAVMPVLRSDPETDARAKWASNWLQVRLGVLLLVWAGYHLVVDPGSLFNREVGETFVLAPILTLASLPLFLAWSWYSEREQKMLHRRWHEHLAS
jgi:hypothetical protein